MALVEESHSVSSVGDMRLTHSRYYQLLTSVSLSTTFTYLDIIDARIEIFKLYLEKLKTHLVAQKQTFLPSMLSGKTSSKKN